MFDLRERDSSSGSYQEELVRLAEDSLPDDGPGFDVLVTVIGQAPRELQRMSRYCTRPPTNLKPK